MVDYKKPLNKILAKDMDRREFLTHTGAAVLTIVGVTGLLKALSNSYGNQQASTGYGSSPYGGGDEARPASKRQLG